MRKMILVVFLFLIIVPAISAQLTEHRVALRGTGVAGCDLAIANGDTDFGEIPIGGSNEIQFSVVNRSTFACEVFSVETTAPMFPVSIAALPFTVPANSSVADAFAVAYMPSSLGPEEAELVIRWRLP